MADRTTERRWLTQLTAIPTAPGREDRVLSWVRRWAGRRPDVRLRADRAGNLLLTIKGRKRFPPVVAVAHTDHPAFVVTGVEGRTVDLEFRGGVRPEYFAGATLEIFDRDDGRHRARLQEHDPETGRSRAALDRAASLAPGDIGRWALARNRGGAGRGFLAAPACDDLAGAAAALAALDRARSDPAVRHLGVLLTRAEEVGFIGAIAAAEAGTLSPDSRVISIECSRSFEGSPVGGGPVVRVGDATSIFDHELTNRIAAAARRRRLTHQRQLMAGGTCEATAFVAFGYRAAGLCLALGNYHNMGFLDEVESGRGMAKPLPEVVSLSDFEGLVDLTLLAASCLDQPDDLADRLRSRFDRERAVLDG